MAETQHDEIKKSKDRVPRSGPSAEGNTSSKYLPTALMLPKVVILWLGVAQPLNLLSPPCARSPHTYYLQSQVASLPILAPLQISPLYVHTLPR